MRATRLFRNIWRVNAVLKDFSPVKRERLTLPPVGS